MKKAITLSFLLLANTVLLIHVAIPHHHHSKVTVCFLVTPCSDSKEAHKHTHDSGCQQHNDRSKEEECPLKEVYMRLENNKSLVDISLENDAQHAVLFLFPVNPMDGITGLKGLPFRQNPYLLPCYTDHISQSLGLRAPPVC